MKLDLKLREATDAMQSHMDAYRAACDKSWAAEREKHLLHDTMGRFGREVANTITRRIRNRVGPGIYFSVNAVCAPSVDHRNYTVTPHIRITLNMQCRRDQYNHNTAIANIESTWSVFGQSVSNIEETIKLVVATVKLNATPLGA